MMVDISAVVGRSKLERGDIRGGAGKMQYLQLFLLHGGVVVYEY